MPSHSLAEEGNPHTFQGPCPNHGCHNYHWCQMLRPSRWRFNHCHNHTQAQRKPPLTAKRAVQARKTEAQGPRPYVWASANTPVGATMKHGVYLMPLLS